MNRRLVKYFAIYVFYLYCGCRNFVKIFRFLLSPYNMKIRVKLYIILGGESIIKFQNFHIPLT